MASQAARPGAGNNAGGGKLAQFKLVLLGESAVGKSSLVLRFVKGQFHEFQESTIGAAFLTQTVVLDDATVKFEIWDTAGQERYHRHVDLFRLLGRTPIHIICQNDVCLFVAEVTHFSVSTDSEQGSLVNKKKL